MKILNKNSTVNLEQINCSAINKFLKNNINDAICMILFAISFIAVGLVAVILPSLVNEPGKFISFAIVGAFLIVLGLVLCVVGIKAIARYCSDKNILTNGSINYATVISECSNVIKNNVKYYSITYGFTDRNDIYHIAKSTSIYRENDVESLRSVDYILIKYIGAHAIIIAPLIGQELGDFYIDVPQDDGGDRSDSKVNETEYSAINEGENDEYSNVDDLISHSTVDYSHVRELDSNYGGDDSEYSNDDCDNGDDTENDNYEDEYDESESLAEQYLVKEIVARERAKEAANQAEKLKISKGAIAAIIVSMQIIFFSIVLSLKFSNSMITIICAPIALIIAIVVALVSYTNVKNAKKGMTSHEEKTESPCSYSEYSDNNEENENDTEVDGPDSASQYGGDNEYNADDTWQTF